MAVSPTQATGKRPAARRVFAEKAVWLRCSSVEDPPRVFSFVAPHHSAFSAKTAPFIIFRQALSLRSRVVLSEPCWACRPTRSNSSLPGVCQGFAKGWTLTKRPSLLVCQECQGCQGFWQVGGGGAAGATIADCGLPGLRITRIAAPAFRCSAPDVRCSMFRSRAPTRRQNLVYFVYFRGFQPSGFTPRFGFRGQPRAVCVKCR